MNKLVNIKNISSLKSLKYVHTSAAKLIDQDWRTDQRLSANPNKEGPLTNLPDYTYMDGRPTPLGRRQTKRVMHQRELAQKIVTGSWEIDYAINRHKKIQENEVKAKEDILKNKLKPKGHLLLKKE